MLYCQVFRKIFLPKNFISLIINRLILSYNLFYNLLLHISYKLPIFVPLLKRNDMKVYKYLIQISHDKGTFTVTTVATGDDSAIRMVCRQENCPISAVKIINKETLQ